MLGVLLAVGSRLLLRAAWAQAAYEPASGLDKGVQPYKIVLGSAAAALAEVATRGDPGAHGPSEVGVAARGPPSALRVARNFIS